MSKTISLVDHLLRQARSLEDLGRRHDARTILQKLSGLRQLSREAAEETQHRLAGLCAEAEDYTQARRHLASALTYQPNHPEYHLEMTRAMRADENCSDEQVLFHFRLAVALDADNTVYLREYGQFTLERGLSEQGLGLLRRAQAAAPDDLDSLECLAVGLAGEGHAEESRQVLRAAMFRNSGDRRYQDLYRAHQFRLLHQEQARRSSIAFPDNAPVLLPFRRPAPKKKRVKVEGKVLRLDAAEPPAGPRRTTRPSHRKQV